MAPTRTLRLVQSLTVSTARATRHGSYASSIVVGRSFSNNSSQDKTTNHNSPSSPSMSSISSSSLKSPPLPLFLEGYSLSHPECNVAPNIASRVGINLHQQPNHPIHTIKTMIQSYFHDFTAIDDLSPIVSTQQNFDSLLVPPDHVSRQRSDTYYLNDTTVLRTHTSAHQTTLLQQQGLQQFLVTGDVYRRDEIDASHYPVFHQMEGVKMFPSSSASSSTTSTTSSAREELKPVVEMDLKQNLQGMAQHLFGDVEMR